MSQYEPIHSHEQPVPFVFHEEEPTVVNDNNISKLMDFLVYYILPDSNPRLKIALMTYAAGYDVGRVLGCNNTQRDIAKTLNVNHRQFSNMLKDIEKDFGLKAINDSNIRTPNTYKKK